MKKIIFFLLAAIFCFNLTACSEVPAPEKAADGTPWSDDWVTISNVMGIDTPEGLTLQDNKDALAASGMYYSTWSIGEETSYIDKTDDEEKEVTIYDAQLFLLLSGSSSTEETEKNREEWLAMADEHYQIDSEETGTWNGQEYTLISYHLTEQSLCERRFCLWNLRKLCDHRRIFLSGILRRRPAGISGYIS